MTRKPINPMAHIIPPPIMSCIMLPPIILRQSVSLRVPHSRTLASATANSIH
jgi:hypothetical protein